MGNLTPFSESPITTALEAWWKKEGEAEAPRRYLGASIIGHECDMYLWLYFRGLLRENFPGRMYRLFDRGRREEATFVRELRGIGCEVWDVNPNTGKQFAVSVFGGHFGGHLDGVGRGIPGAPKTPHVLEFKTHSSSSFAKLQKDGVRVSKPMHYAQMQTYMGLMHLSRALYLAVNKDTDAVHAERITFEQDVFDQIMRRAKRIITSGYSAEKCSTRPDDWRCRMCPAAGICWPAPGDKRLTIIPKDTVVDCRTCCHATPDTTGTGGRWTCNRGEVCRVCKATWCPMHTPLPELVNGSVQHSTEGGAIKYRTNDGVEFTVGPGGDFSTQELVQMESAQIGPVKQVKQVFPGSVVVEVAKDEQKKTDD